MLVFQCIVVHAEDVVRTILAVNEFIHPYQSILPGELLTPMYVLIYILSQYTILSYHHLTATRETNLSIMIHWRHCLRSLAALILHCSTICAWLSHTALADRCGGLRPQRGEHDC